MTQKSQKLLRRPSKTKRHFILPAAFVPIIVLLGSCGRNPDLAKIERFSESAKAAEEEFSIIGSDIYGSCIRAAEYQPILLESSQPFALRENALKTCEQNPRKVEQQLLQSHSVIVNYLKALGQLASDKTVDLSGLDAIQASFRSLPTRQPNDQSKPALTEDQLEAGSGILSIISEIFRASVERSRLEKVQFFIVKADDNVQKLAQGFTTIVEKGYLPYLTDEEKAIDGYYEVYIGGLLRHRTDGDTMNLTNYLLDLHKDWRTNKDKVRDREVVAKSYIDLIQSIAATHQSFRKKFEQGKGPTTAELNHTLDQYNAKLDNLVKQLKLAYKN